MIEGNAYPISVARLRHTLPIATEIGHAITYNDKEGRGMSDSNSNSNSNSNMWTLKCSRRKNIKEPNLLTCISKVSIMMAP